MRKLVLINAVLIISILACAGPARRRQEMPGPLDKSSAKKLIRETKKHLGEPYHSGGTSPKGWDCSGFVMTMYSKCLGIPLPHKSARMFDEGFAMPLSYAKPGDLAFFRPRNGKPTHVGIYIGKRKFIHASRSGGVTISSLDDKYYSRTFMGIRRIASQNISSAR